MIYCHFTLFKHHFHYLGIYLHVFGEQDMLAFKVGFMLLLEFGNMLLLDRAAELIEHIVGKKRLCDKAVNSRFFGFVHNIVPLISRNYDYSRLVTNYITQLLCGLNAVHSGHFEVNKYKVVKLVPCVMNAYSFYCLRTRKNGLA